MLIPRRIRNEMALVETAPFEIQERLQNGCNCGCGWSGDRMIVVRELPAKRGNGWAVLDVEPGKVPVVLYRSDQQQPLDPYAADHRVIDYLQAARKNWENQHMIEQMMADHDAKVETEKQQQETEMTIELSKMARHHLKKEGKL